MNTKKRLILYIVYIVLGLALFVLGCMELVDEFWSGMGGGLIAVSVLQLLRMRRLYTDVEYREKIEISLSDERNSYIRLKAWGWTGYLQILILGVAVIVFKIMGLELWSLAASYGVCLTLILYWVSYLFLQRKY